VEEVIGETSWIESCHLSFTRRKDPIFWLMGGLK